MLSYKRGYKSVGEGHCTAPDAEELDVSLWCRDGELDFIVTHGDLGTQSTFMVHACVCFNCSYHKLWDINAHLGNKLHPHGWHE